MKFEEIPRAIRHELEERPFTSSSSRETTSLQPQEQPVTEIRSLQKIKHKLEHAISLRPEDIAFLDGAPKRLDWMRRHLLPDVRGQGQKILELEVTSEPCTDMWDCECSDCRVLQL
jgi:hypothetical protein